jgi:hypothetical protein
MGSHDPFEYLQHKLWLKKKVRSQSVNLTFDYQKSGIALNYVCASDVPYIVGKFLTRATTLF